MKPRMPISATLRSEPGGDPAERHAGRPAPACSVFTRPAAAQRLDQQRRAPSTASPPRPSREDGRADLARRAARPGSRVVCQPAMRREGEDAGRDENLARWRPAPSARSGVTALSRRGRGRQDRSRCASVSSRGRRRTRRRTDRCRSSRVFFSSSCQAGLFDHAVDQSRASAFFCASRDARRAEHAAPVEQLDIDALFFQGRHVDAVLPLVGGDAPARATSRP